MNRTKKLIAMPFALAALTAPMFLASCDTIGSNPLDALCCTQFKPGTNMVTADWDLEGSLNLEFGAAMQAVGDFSATAQGMVNDLTVACRGMAIDMGAKEDAVVEPDPNKAVVAWCTEAMNQLATFKADINITVQPAKCEVSVSAKLDCEAQCDASVQCELTPGEIKAACEPGKLSGQCSGSCSGTCEGSASLAVTCNGTCDGTCEGMCMGTQDGGKCNGTCNGKCRGSCTADGSAMAKCEGSCSGDCSVDFKAPKCNGTFTPPKAECKAQGSCEASCDASASAKAECTPPAVEITGGTNIDEKIAALKKWLPQIYLNIEGRLSLLVDQATAFGTITGSFNLEATAQSAAVFCLPTAIAAVASAGDNIVAVGSASVKIFAGVGQGG